MINSNKYGQYIAEHIQNLPICEPVTTTAVADALANAFGMDINNAKKITNVTMKRLTDKGELTRVQKGIYGKTKITPFGKLTPNADEIIAGVLLRKDNATIGYITGPTLLNAVGLCSLVPKERHITTNHYRRQVPAGINIRLHKPVVTVNDENARYLQAIDMFMAMERYHVDTEKTDEILSNILQRSNINNEKLILYARKFGNSKILLKTIDIVLGGIEL